MNIASVESIDATEVVDRLKKLLNLDSDRKLSEVLGLSFATIGVAKRKGKLPWDSVLKLCKEKGISVDALLDIEMKVTHQPKPVVANSNTDTEPYTATAKNGNAGEINALVDKVVSEALDGKSLTPDAELRVYKNVRPMLIDTALQYGLHSEAILRKQMSSALAMLL